MKNLIKRIAPSFIKEIRVSLIEKAQYNTWIKNGKKTPPHSIFKRKVIDSYRQENNIDVLIETGTCHGGTVYSLKNKFKAIHSIEIDSTLFEYSKNRLKNFKNVELHFGDSGDLLPNILNKLNSRCLFWLDGHYSGIGTGKGILETPIYKELEAILNHNQKHIILIDDARLFNGTKDYPTLDEIIKLILKKWPNSIIQNEMDIIRIELK